MRKDDLMKRFLSLILAFLLALSPLSGLNHRASAAEIITISEITMPEIPALGKGDSTDLSWAVAPAGEHYTIDISKSRWLYPIATDHLAVYSESAFGAGVYSLELMLVPAEGYAFADTVTVTTAGYGQTYTISSDSLRVSAANVIDTRELIPAVAITGFPEVVAGESYDCSTVACSTEGVTVTARTFASGAATGTFQPGNAYQFELFLDIPLDKKISDETVITVNGKTTEGWTRQYFVGRASMASPQISLPSPTINQIQLLNLPKVEFGASTDLTGIQVSADAPYYIDFSHPSTRVLKSENNISSDYYEDTFDTGIFSYHLVVQPKVGYSFGDTVTVVCEENGFYTWHPTIGVMAVCSPQYKISPTMISEVGINYTEPVKGQTPDTAPPDPRERPLYPGILHMVRKRRNGAVRHRHF